MTAADPVQPAHNQDAAVPQIVLPPLPAILWGNGVAADAFVYENVLLADAVGCWRRRTDLYG